jgi:hypothetical protein
MKHTRRELIRGFDVAWEIPLALMSFVFYRITRFCVQRLIHLNAIVSTAQSRRWRVFSAQEARSPLNLLAVMTSGPRLNTHAIVATVGPLHVKRTLRIHVAAAARSAAAWTVVVYTAPSHRTAASVGSLGTPNRESWQAITLPPGRYRLALRYYHWSNGVELPAVDVDGIEAVPRRIVLPNVNDFYNDLSKRSNLLYLCLHYYVGTLLRYRALLPQSLVEREYLPVGNPETTFYYGFLSRREALAVDLDARLLQTHDVYFTLYNRASFPIQWYALTEPQHITSPSACDGTYLIRIHRRAQSTEPFAHDSVRMGVLAETENRGRQSATATSREA